LDLGTRIQNHKDINQLAVLLSTFTDGSGQLKSISKKYNSLPGWLDIERTCAEFFNGKTLEKKDVFDVVIPKENKMIGVSIKTKCVGTPLKLFNLDNGQLYLELTNSSATIWNELKQHNLQESDFGNNSKATIIGSKLVEIANKIQSKSTVEKIDFDESRHIVFSYSKPTNKDPSIFYKIHVLKMNINEELVWKFSSDKCLRGSLGDKTIVDWYGLSGGQLKYYPLASNSTHTSPVFSLFPLNRLSISDKAKNLVRSKESLIINN